MVTRFSVLAIVIAVVPLSVPAQEATEIEREAKDIICKRGHAHNDYLHERPLLDAVDNGFCSAEADVFLINGKLLVAHTIFGLRPSRTLESMYLQPLKQLVEKNSGSVHGDGTPFTLLIDIKNNGVETYRTLDALLNKYADIFTMVDDGVAKQGSVVAIVSGDRPTQAIESDRTRFVGIDGRMSDLNSTKSVDLMPLISDKWSKHFQWRGDGEFPESEKQKLTGIVSQVHAAGRRIRFWATPDKPSVWKVLDDAGVDLINTDDLVGLSEYLQRSR